VSQSMQAGILQLSFVIDDASSDHCRPQESRDDMHMVPQPAFAVGKQQAEIALGAHEVPFSQRIHDERVNRNRAISSLAFGPHRSCRTYLVKRFQSPDRHLPLYKCKSRGQRDQKRKTDPNISASVTANIAKKASPYSWATLDQSTFAKSSKTVSVRMCRPSCGQIPSLRRNHLRTTSLLIWTRMDVTAVTIAAHYRWDLLGKGST